MHLVLVIPFNAALLVPAEGITRLGRYKYFSSRLLLALPACFENRVQKKMATALVSNTTMKAIFGNHVKYIYANQTIDKVQRKWVSLHKHP